MAILVLDKLRVLADMSLQHVIELLLKFAPLSHFPHVLQFKLLSQEYGLAPTIKKHLIIVYILVGLRCRYFTLKLAIWILFFFKRCLLLFKFQFFCFSFGFQLQPQLLQLILLVRRIFAFGFLFGLSWIALRINLAQFYLCTDFIINFLLFF